MSPSPSTTGHQPAATADELLHLFLTFHWFDETESGRKRIEYRVRSRRWMRLIYARRDRIGWVRFARGYTKRTITYRVDHIDLGRCPIKGWRKKYIRIHFSVTEECGQKIAPDGLPVRGVLRVNQPQREGAELIAASI